MLGNKLAASTSSGKSRSCVGYRELNEERSKQLNLSEEFKKRDTRRHTEILTHILNGLRDMAERVGFSSVNSSRSSRISEI